jgi:hypothetical protein
MPCLPLARFCHCSAAKSGPVVPDGRFDQDDARVRYLRWLRAAVRRSERTPADADFVRAKTERIDVRICEKNGIRWRPKRR